MHGGAQIRSESLCPLLHVVRTRLASALDWQKNRLGMPPVVRYRKEVPGWRSSNIAGGALYSVAMAVLYYQLKCQLKCRVNFLSAVLSAISIINNIWKPYFYDTKKIYRSSRVYFTDGSDVGTGCIFH